MCIYLVAKYLHSEREWVIHMKKNMYIHVFSEIYRMCLYEDLLPL